MTVTFSRLGDEEYWGRLGNQLWEVASTYGIAKRNGQNCVFPIWKYSSWFLNVPTGYKFNYPIYNEGNDLSYRDINLTGDIDLVGYFQSYKYFDHCKEEILKLFETNFDIDEPITEVAMHVRRGDYLNKSNFHTNLGVFNYYGEAVNHFRHQRLTIFSDDIAWCKSIFGPNHFYVVPVSDIMDLIYMSKHKHFIIANSSYSWWAAYLGKHPEKKVIAPKNWWVNISSDDVCPPDWIRI